MPMAPAIGLWPFGRRRVLQAAMSFPELRDNHDLGCGISRQPGHGHGRARMPAGFAKDLDEEVDFQNNYYTVLGFFYREFQTRTNNFAFLGFVEDFISYFSMKSNLPDPAAKWSLPAPTFVPSRSPRSASSRRRPPGIPPGAARLSSAP